ncbi:SLBB domain-containing protein [candidate division KSB1 bacterium]|nr:SLBB domain-containing protein [candidate division KSB1 bacterium]
MKKIILCAAIITQIFVLSLETSYNQTINNTNLETLSSTNQLGKENQTKQPPHQLLPLFGSNLFGDIKDIEDAKLVGTGIFPEDYFLGPGDRLGIYMLGKDQREFEVIVNVEGKIFIPTVGVLHVDKMKIDEFQGFLKQQLSRYYENFSVNVILIEPKHVSVAVVGEVKRPGKYFLTSLNTVLDAVVLAGGATQRGSLRNIEIYRENKLCGVIDFYQFLLKGEAENDLFLQSNDKVVVPLIETIISVDGDVKRPARFELKTNGNERLSDIIELAGGFTDLAYLNKIEISSLMENGERFVQYVNFHEILKTKDNAGNIQLKNNDKIFVFSILEQTYAKDVFIHGEVKKPGRYDFEENLFVRDLILKAGNLTRSAYKLEGEVAKIDPQKPANFIKIDLQKILSDPAAKENILLEEDDRVFIRQIPEWEVGLTIQIKGEVLFPGIYAITEDSTTLNEILEKAGGFTDEALIREASLIRQSSKISIDKEYMRLKQIPRDQLSKNEYEYLVMKEGSQDIGRIVVDFYKLCVQKDKTEDVFLKDGDFINIPEAPNVVYVTGRVSNAGGVLYEPGKKIKYYLKKAGGVTWDAKSRDIKVTKVTGEIIDDEDVKSLEPGDIIWVPRKPDRDWWEVFRQTIAVIAQVATVYIVVDRALMKN